MEWKKDINDLDWNGMEEGQAVYDAVVGGRDAFKVQDAFVHGRHEQPLPDVTPTLLQETAPGGRARADPRRPRLAPAPAAPQRPSSPTRRLAGTSRASGAPVLIEHSPVHLSGHVLVDVERGEWWQGERPADDEVSFYLYSWMARETASACRSAQVLLVAWPDCD